MYKMFTKKIRMSNLTKLHRASVYCVSVNVRCSIHGFAIKRPQNTMLKIINFFFKILWYISYCNSISFSFLIYKTFGFIIFLSTTHAIYSCPYFNLHIMYVRV